MCESETAKDVFGGRLNADMVAEKLGHTSYRDLSELNLLSSSVRFTLTLTSILESELNQHSRAEGVASRIMISVLLCVLEWWISLLWICSVIYAVLI